VLVGRGKDEEKSPGPLFEPLKTKKKERTGVQTTENRAASNCQGKKRNEGASQARVKQPEKETKDGGDDRFQAARENEKNWAMGQKKNQV